MWLLALLGLTLLFFRCTLILIIIFQNVSTGLIFNKYNSLSACLLDNDTLGNREDTSIFKEYTFFMGRECRLNFYYWPVAIIETNSLLDISSGKKIRGQSLLVLKLCGFKYNSILIPLPVSWYSLLLWTHFWLPIWKSHRLNCSLMSRNLFQGHSYDGTCYSSYMCDEFVRYFNSSSNWSIAYLIEEVIEF